ncbi:MAG: class I SAM-dependent methyltransferase, partial [Rhodococcus sp. (in: high G+C Gram-positive bacteria)]
MPIQQELSPRPSVLLHCVGMEEAGEVTEVKTTSCEAGEWDARYSERDRVWSGE